MPTFSYSPTESVTLGPNGEVSVTDGGTTTTFTKMPPSKTVTKTPPDPNPPPPENPLSTKLKPPGDLIHTYSDITKTPPVTVKINYKANGDIEIMMTIGQDRNLMEINPTTGVRRMKVWRDPDPEPSAWGKIQSPRVPGSKSSGKKKSNKKPAGRFKSAKRSPAKRKSATKKKARRR